MDVQTIFKRYERKYLLTKEQKERLMEPLSEPDPPVWDRPSGILNRRQLPSGWKNRLPEQKSVSGIRMAIS